MNDKYGDEITVRAVQYTVHRWLHDQQAEEDTEYGTVKSNRI